MNYSGPTILKVGLYTATRQGLLIHVDLNTTQLISKPPRDLTRDSNFDKGILFDLARIFCWSLLVILNSHKKYASLKPSPLLRHFECLIFLFLISMAVPYHTCSFFYLTANSLFASEAVPKRLFQPETSFGSFAREQSLPGTEALISGGWWLPRPFEEWGWKGFLEMSIHFKAELYCLCLWILFSLEVEF